MNKASRIANKVLNKCIGYKRARRIRNWIRSAAGWLGFRVGDNAFVLVGEDWELYDKEFECSLRDVQKESNIDAGMEEVKKILEEDGFFVKSACRGGSLHIHDRPMVSVTIKRLSFCNYEAYSKMIKKSLNENGITDVVVGFSGYGMGQALGFKEDIESAGEPQLDIMFGALSTKRLFANRLKFMTIIVLATSAEDVWSFIERFI